MIDRWERPLRAELLRIHPQNHLQLRCLYEIQANGILFKPLSYGRCQGRTYSPANTASSSDLPPCLPWIPGMQLNFACPVLADRTRTVWSRSLDLFSLSLVFTFCFCLLLQELTENTKDINSLFFFLQPQIFWFLRMVSCKLFNSVLYLTDG